MNHDWPAASAGGKKRGKRLDAKDTRKIIGPKESRTRWRLASAGPRARETARGGEEEKASLGACSNKMLGGSRTNGALNLTE